MTVPATSLKAKAETGRATFETTLLQNYPNPTGKQTVIPYVIGEDDNVSLRLYDVTGKMVQILSEEHQSAGLYEVNINTGELPKGVYIYTLRTKDGQLTKKMIVE